MPKYEIKFAGFDDALALHDVVLKEIKEAGVNINLEDIDLSAGLSSSSINIDTLLKPILGVASSSGIREAAFKCLESSLYNGEKITRATFDNEKAIEHYYSILIECVKVNLTPFFKKLASQLGKLDLEKIISSQK